MKTRHHLLVAVALIAMLAWWSRPTGPVILSLAGYRLGDPLPTGKEARQDCDADALFMELEGDGEAFIADDDRIIRGIASTAELHIGKDKVLTKFLTLEAISRVLDCPVSRGNRFALGNQVLHVHMHPVWGGADAYLLVDERWNRRIRQRTTRPPFRQASIQGLRVGDSRPAGSRTFSENGQDPTWLSQDDGTVQMVGGAELKLDGVRYIGEDSLPRLKAFLGPSTTTISDRGKSYDWKYEDIQVSAYQDSRQVRFGLSDYDVYSPAGKQLLPNVK